MTNKLFLIATVWYVRACVRACVRVCVCVCVCVCVILLLLLCFVGFNVFCFVFCVLSVCCASHWLLIVLFIAVFNLCDILVKRCCFFCFLMFAGVLSVFVWWWRWCVLLLLLLFFVFFISSIFHLHPLGFLHLKNWFDVSELQWTGTTLTAPRFPSLSGQLQNKEFGQPRLLAYFAVPQAWCGCQGTGISNVPSRHRYRDCGSRQRTAQEPSLTAVLRHIAALSWAVHSPCLVCPLHHYINVYSQSDLAKLGMTDIYN